MKKKRWQLPITMCVVMALSISIAFAQNTQLDTLSSTQQSDSINAMPANGLVAVAMQKTIQITGRIVNENGAPVRCVHCSKG